MDSIARRSGDEGRAVVILGFLLSQRLRPWPTMLVLLAGLAIMTTAAVRRGTEYDENYTMFLAAGTPRPVWPAAAFTAGSVRHVFAGHSTVAGIARDLRETDVHPPLYFWTVAAWRAVFGTGLRVTRIASVLASLAALLCLGRLAELTLVPPVAAMLLTLGCYGFAYTGEVARGFALAQLFSLGGLVLLVLAERRSRQGHRGQALAVSGGLLLGLASFTNYLTAFVAAAALLWLLLRRPRDVSLWLAGGLGFALLLPADLYFFAAQYGSRVGQFPPFRLAAALLRLAEYGAANVFGGLPLYAPGRPGVVIGVLVGVVLLALAAVIAWRWRRIATPGARLLFGMGLLAMPVGLLVLGFVFDNTPVELRYVAFATPFFGLLAAGAFASLSGRWRPALLFALTFAIQGAALVGMVTRPETMQPQAAVAQAATRAADGTTVVLVPRGNDGVGVVAAVVNEVPDDLHLLVVDQGASADQLAARTGGFHRVALALLGLDAESKRAIAMMSAVFAAAPCWQAVPSESGIAVYDRVCTEGAQADSGPK